VVAIRPIGVGFFSTTVPEGTEGTILAVKDGGFWSGSRYVVKWNNGAVVEAGYDDLHQL
jgi:hypothetical protein